MWCLLCAGNSCDVKNFLTANREVAMLLNKRKGKLLSELAIFRGKN
jgi:hypothetical protein